MPAQKSLYCNGRNNYCCSMLCFVWPFTSYIHIHSR